MALPDELAQDAESRLLLCVLDGLGDLPGPDGQTPLEAASTPNLDRLAAGGTQGLFTPVGAGITPGSGPGHLGLFGYDPVAYQIGRGVLSALGVDFDLKPGDVAARFNFCTLDASGHITDRRAGRLPTETNRRLIAMLRERVTSPSGCELFWETESEHRGLLVLRGAKLNPEIEDTDPQREGVPPNPVRAKEPGARTTARIVQEVLDAVRTVIGAEQPANGLLLRGCASLPDWPDFRSRFRLRALAVARYPMYRGVARLVGMDVAPAYDALQAVPGILSEGWSGHDFFFVHFKDTDKAGEDGDFDRKRSAIESFDLVVPDLLDLGPEVLVVTGDHSTPVPLLGHSWHPVPVLLHAPTTVRPDRLTEFGERAAIQGGLGRSPMKDLLPLMLAHGRRLAKFGA